MQKQEEAGGGVQAPSYTVSRSPDIAGERHSFGGSLVGQRMLSLSVCEGSVISTGWAPLDRKS